jgi:hypothetical protein
MARVEGFANTNTALFRTKSIITETIFLDFVIVYKMFIHIDFRVRFRVLGNFLPLSLQSAS